MRLGLEDQLPDELCRLDPARDIELAESHSLLAIMIDRRPTVRRDSSERRVPTALAGLFCPRRGVAVKRRRSVPASRRQNESDPRRSDERDGKPERKPATVSLIGGERRR